MKAPAIVPAGVAGVAASAALTTRRRWRAVLGALLLALTPGLASAATDTEEWPTAPDRGTRSAKRIPWLRFSGDPTAPVVAAVPGHAVYAHDVVVVREQELSRRQRRLLRRAQRHAEKAADLRARAEAGRRDAYATVVVPVVQAAPPAPPAPPRPIVVRPARPAVHVVRLAQERDESGGCHKDHDEDHAHTPVVIDGARISADVERQVERALREAERAHQRAERDRERAERDRERALRDAERALRSHR